MKFIKKQRDNSLKETTMEKIDIPYSDLIHSAMIFSMEKHKGQNHKNKILPYFSHEMDVCKKVLSYVTLEYDIIKDRQVIELISLASLLHDTIEDTNTTFDEIKEKFGYVVANTVLELTQDGNKSEKEKFEYLKSFEKKSHSAKIIKFADRYSNIKDFLDSPDTSWYACKYALLGYPIYRAYLKTGSKMNPKIISDMAEIECIVRRRYLVSIMTSTPEEIEEALFGDKKT